MAADREIHAQMGASPYAAKGFNRIPDGRKVTSSALELNPTFFTTHYIKRWIEAPPLKGYIGFRPPPLRPPQLGKAFPLNGIR